MKTSVIPTLPIKTQCTPFAKRNFVERNFYSPNNALCCNKRLQREEFEAASHYDCIYANGTSKRRKSRRARRRISGTQGSVRIGPVIISTKKTSQTTLMNRQRRPPLGGRCQRLSLHFFFFFFLVRSSLSLSFSFSLFLYARQLSSATIDSVGPSAR